MIKINACMAPKHKIILSWPKKTTLPSHFDATYNATHITAQLHATKLELRFCAGLSSACSMLEICKDEDL